MTIKKDVSFFIRKVERTIGKSANKRILTDLGKMAISIIRARTRRGFGVKQAGGPASRLEGLSQAYIAFRKKRGSGLNTALTTPGKSNLTFKGVLLDSLRVVRVDTNEKTVFINANKRRRKGGTTNEQIAQFVADNGREFLNLSRRELFEVTKRFERTFINQFNKNFER